jgi:hypothetical protein
MISYDSLKIIVELAHKNAVNGRWTTAQSNTFLRENGIKTDYCKTIVARAKDCHDYRVAQENYEKDPQTYEKLEKDRRMFPKKYSMARIPSVWSRNLPLDIFVDTPMHLLFLGIAKSMFCKITEWSIARGRKKEFNVLAVQQLKDLDSLKLQWLTFPWNTFDSWGGWVSEKFQSLSRVALWIYGPLMDVDDMPPFVDPVDRTLDNWLVDQYRKWLKAVGKDATGTQPELKARVLHYKSLPLEQQPKFLPPECGSAVGVMQVLRTMVMMLTTILQPKVDGEKHALILAIRIRLFLNAVADFEAPLREYKRKSKTKKTPTKKGGKKAVTEDDEEAVEYDEEEEIDAEVVVDNDLQEESTKGGKKKKNEPLWIARSNFLCLLNLPDTIQKFGSPRNYFEGKYLGERYVQEVKNCRSRCGNKDLMVNLLRKLHQGKALEAMTTTQSPNIKTYRSTEVLPESSKKKMNCEETSKCMQAGLQL